MFNFTFWFELNLNLMVYCRASWSKFFIKLNAIACKNCLTMDAKNCKDVLINVMGMLVLPMVVLWFIYRNSYLEACAWKLYTPPTLTCMKLHLPTFVPHMKIAFYNWRYARCALSTKSWLYGALSLNMSNVLTGKQRK